MLKKIKLKVSNLKLDQIIKLQYFAVHLRRIIIFFLMKLWQVERIEIELLSARNYWRYPVTEMDSFYLTSIMYTLMRKCMRSFFGILYLAFKRDRNKIDISRNRVR